MKILFIAPLPPPVAGHSLAAKVFFDHLSKKHSVEPINFNKESFIDGFSSFKRIIEVLEILKKIWKKKSGADIIYLTISESFAGNLKDLFIYIICYRKLSNMYLHLHGGSIKRLLWDRYKILYAINKFFIKRMKGVIISGPSHLVVFQDFIPLKKIHISPNFALDYLFITEEQIKQKFLNTEPIRLLYMSNMIEKKGYAELANAYLKLSDELKKKIRIDFVGRFELDSQKKSFLDQIQLEGNITYHGVVGDEIKKELFAQAHVFCLPTSYFEGQPISILEAYASGSVVLTTGQSGILDIFENDKNGFQLKEGNSASILPVLIEIVEKRDNLINIALLNIDQARRKYTTSIYNSNLEKIIES